MDEKPRERPWFQYHLSTAIVLMFAAAALLWLNLGLREHRLYGWPFHVYSYDFTYYDAAIGGYHVTPTTNDVAWLVANVVVCLLLLAGVGIMCERRLALLQRWPRPAVLVVELCCLVLCVLWNLSSPLSWYFSEDLAAPLVARVLSWLFLTFSAAWICEWWLGLRPETRRGVIVTLTLAVILGYTVLMLPWVGGMKSGGHSPRRDMLCGIQMALLHYENDYGCFPPDERPRKSSGQTLFEYLCAPLPPGGAPILSPRPGCFYVRPDGVTELRGPSGHRYLYRLMPSETTGRLEPVVEEIQPNRRPRDDSLRRRAVGP